MLSKTNIEEKLRKTRNRKSSETQIQEEIAAIFSKNEEERQGILQELKNPETAVENSFNFDFLETKNIFHISTIEKTCIDYRLRFLSTKLYNFSFPQEAISKIKHLEKQHQTKISGFKIMAPGKFFKLKNADDPLLFAPIGTDYFYLIHKWGNDLHPLRKLLMKPFKNMENFVIFIFGSSLILSFFVPMELFSKDANMLHFILIWLFVFKSALGICIYYGFAKGKNFSESIWQSEYSNA